MHATANALRKRPCVCVCLCVQLLITAQIKLLNSRMKWKASNVSHSHLCCATYQRLKIAASESHRCERGWHQRTPRVYEMCDSARIVCLFFSIPTNTHTHTDKTRRFNEIYSRLARECVCMWQQSGRGQKEVKESGYGPSEVLRLTYATKARQHFPHCMALHKKCLVYTENPKREH